MTLRFIAGLLWFVAVSSLVSFAESLLGNPREIGAVIGALVGGFVVIDPFGVFWPRGKSTSAALTRRWLVRVDRLG